MDTSALLQLWFSKHKRALPWRATYDPYRIWLSEIILQQTQVVQGIGYYRRFVAEYPTVCHLAKATESSVLKNWQGLGYYTRARNLHATAVYICNHLHGIFPSSHDALLKLKGIGPYTAAAIASIAFQEPVAAVDGNVYRVLSRLFDIATPINSPAGIKLFQKLADSVLDPSKPGTHNEAMMELGATICTPAKPNCRECPIAEKCLAFKNHTMAYRPVKLKKAKPVKRELNYLVVYNTEEMLFKKRGSGDIWQGLHDFPEMAGPAGPAGINLASELESHGLSIEKCIIREPVEVYSHKLTHQTISARFWQVKVPDNLPDNSLYLPINKNDLKSIPVPRLIEKYIQKELINQ